MLRVEVLEATTRHGQMPGRTCCRTTPTCVIALSSTTVNVKVDPAPGVDVTPIVPDMRSTSCLLMASPSPVPP